METIYFAILFYVVAQIADVVTTVRALRRGAKEANPIIRWMMETLGNFWPVFKFALSGIAVFLMWQAGVEWVIWLIAGITFAVAVRNEWFVQR